LIGSRRPQRFIRAKEKSRHELTLITQIGKYEKRFLGKELELISIMPSQAGAWEGELKVDYNFNFINFR